MVRKSVCGRRYIAYNEGFGLDILVYPTEVLQKIRAQKNREIRLADATCLIYGLVRLNMLYMLSLNVMCFPSMEDIWTVINDIRDTRASYLSSRLEEKSVGQRVAISCSLMGNLTPNNQGRTTSSFSEPIHSAKTINQPTRLSAHLHIKTSTSANSSSP